MFNVQYVNIALDDGLTPNRQQSFIRKHDAVVYWSIYPSLGFNVLSDLQDQMLADVPTWILIKNENYIVDSIRQKYTEMYV